MQRDLVERARKGDHDAFAALAGATAGRLDAAARDVSNAADMLWTAPTVMARFEDTGRVCAELAAELGPRTGRRSADGPAQIPARVRPPVPAFRRTHLGGLP